MKIVIFSGTTEGRELSRLLAEAGAEVLVCVATDYGAEEQGSLPGVETHVGPLTAEEKRELLRSAALCVDATHPYATHVTASLREACASTRRPYLRLLREESALPEDALCFDRAADAAAYLAEHPGRVLLSTGAKELGQYAALDPARLYPRVLPSQESLRACEALGIPRRNIIAMQGPFSRELNEAILRQYRIDYLLSKDGGEAGGFREKAEAARAVGVRLLVLRRPKEEGGRFQQILETCLEALKEEKKEGSVT